MAFPLIAAAAAAVIGGIAGGQKDSATSYSEGSSESHLNLRNFEDLNKGQSGLEKTGYEANVTGFADLQKLLGMGPGANEVQTNTQYQNTFAGQLQDMLQKLNNPTAADTAANYAKAQQLFAPQQTALNQQFQDQNVASNRLSARLGRAGNDPIMRNKLAQEQTRQQTMLNSQIGSYGQQLPQEQANNLLNIGGNLSNLRAGLATQAFTNRQTLMGMGSQLMNSERQYRINTGQQVGNQYQHGEGLSGGGLKGAVSGATSAFGAVAGMGGTGGGMSSVAKAPMAGQSNLKAGDIGQEKIMSGNDEMMKAFQMFSDGMKQYQTTQAVNDAAEQLNVANANAKDEQDRMVHAQHIGQDLALRLTAAHASPDAIAAATSGLMPSASLQAQSQATLDLEKMKTASAEKIHTEAAKNAYAIAELNASSKNAASDRKASESMMKFGTEFGAQKQIKPILEGLPKIDKALESIKANKGQMGVTAVVELAKLGAIRDAAGRVNEKEIEAANESPSMRAQLWKRAGLEATGETPANVQEFWIKYLSQAKQSANDHLKTSIEGFAEGKATFNDKLDPAKIKKGLKLQYGIKDPADNPNAAAIAAANAWLAANPNHPDAKAVKQKVNQMSGQ